jgi:hypothetical protein
MWRTDLCTDRHDEANSRSLQRECAENKIYDGQLTFNFWFIWGLYLHQHVHDILGPRESSTTWYSGLFCVGVRGSVPGTKKLHCVAPSLRMWSVLQ